MRRWNGWGDDAHAEALSAPARAFLLERLGLGVPTTEARLDAVLGTIPPSTLAAIPGFDATPETRLRHARGQSYPDWIALKYGRIGPVAEAVVSPASHDETAAALATCRKAGAIVVPWGGGTSVVGHLNATGDGRPVVHLSLERLSGMGGFDETAQLATFGAGTPGPVVERQLRERGFLLGHFPQSYEYSTVGGWVVTRSSGQQSMRYGRIENLFAGGRLATPRGTLDVGGVPASSAGPDLREFTMGSEGRLGVLTDVGVRVRPLPEREDFHAVFFPTWDHGIEAMRRIVQSDLALSMLRLSNEVETETQLTLAGHEKAIAWLKRYLKLRGSGTRPVLMLLGCTGLNREVLRLRREALSLCKQSRGVHAGRAIGQGWAKNRFRGPYMRNALWDAGYGADTVETCVNWPKATATMRAIEAAAVAAFAEDGEQVHAFTHLSHVYRQGCSIYSTFVFRSSGRHEIDLARWRRLKTRVSEAIASQGGTISHQHGVGVDHAPWLPAEKGPLGMDLLRAVARELDPDGMMNPGKLFA